MKATSPSTKTRRQKTFSIAIQPGNYRGRYYDSSGTELKGPTTLALAAGKHYISPYGTGMGFEITFKVLASGQIDPASISPKGAASATGASLVFTTVPVTMDVGAFAGSYRIGGYEATKGTSSIDLLVNTWTTLELYRTGYGQFIKVSVAPQGSISTANYPRSVSCIQASGGKPARIRFNTRRVTLRAAPGVSGTVFLGSKAQIVRIGATVDLIIDHPVAVLSQNLKWPAPDRSLGESPGGDPLAPVPLFTFA